MSRRRRRSSRRSLHGFFDPKNKWVWAGVGAAAVVVYIYRKELFGMDDGKTNGFGYLVPTYNPAPTFQGW